MKSTLTKAAGCVLAGWLLVLSGWAAGPPEGTLPTTRKPGASEPPPRDYHEAVPLPRVMRVGMDVLVGGEPLRTIRHEGRTYLPVPRLGAEYEVRIWNHGPRRITAVVSVDGLSVISGQLAAETGPGYIVDPHGAIVIKGWRRSLDAVAAFHFVDRADSYAQARGHPENVGVIGLVAFEEAVPQPPSLWEGPRAAAPAGQPAVARAGGVGTGYGREIDSGVYSVPFVRSANRRALTYYYDTKEGLRKAGVPVSPAPVPFPGSGDFAPPPPGGRPSPARP
jgi:hypothetical protein